MSEFVSRDQAMNLLSFRVQCRLFEAGWRVLAAPIVESLSVSLFHSLVRQLSSSLASSKRRVANSGSLSPSMTCAPVTMLYTITFLARLLLLNKLRL